ncbi:MAG: cysteine hydrolase [Albidovulum sp.]|nr:cysteine hydrolase [Albidovulum sp.]MDE0305423.1 cysteine hydrolase [Albidovulum sp.]MDE0532295.1 cysteine hydrolase [Albidovulum sp.]
MASKAKIGVEMYSRTSSFEAGRTALLVVDMQNEFCIPGKDSQHPELDEQSYFHQRLTSTVLPNQAKLLNCGRRKNVEIVYTVIESLTKDGRDRSPDHKLSGIHVSRGSSGAKMPDAIAPHCDEIVIPKTSSGVFNSTNIDYVLRNLGIRFLIVFGIVTDQCVDMAVRDAADRGYMVTMVDDASATLTRERHAAALSAFGGYCRIASTREVLALLEEIA